LSSPPALQISEKGGAGKKAGLVNAAFAEDAGGAGPGREEAGQAEPWMNNYVPYGKNPAGSPIEQVTFTKEDETDGEKMEKMDEAKKDDCENEKDDKKWKEHYVAYEEKEDDDEEPKRDNVIDKEEKTDNEDEKDVDEKNVEEKDDGTEKL
jgi:hypothetical protein